MSTVVGQWRASYTPGDWVLLSGPTSLVLLEPPPPERASMIEVLWEEVLATSSMTDLAGRLAAYPLDSLPSFAAFFWTENGMRSLVRGRVSVVDLSSGATVADGEGVQTWSEVGLGQVTQVLVDVQAGNGTRLELPLVVGAVRASSVRLDASEAARVWSPQVPVAPAPPAATAESAYAGNGAAYAGNGAAYAGDETAKAGDRDGYAEEYESAASAPYPAEDAGSGADAAWGGLGLGPSAGAAAGLPPVPEPVAELPPPAPVAELAGPSSEPRADDEGPSTELLADPFADDPRPEEWRPDEWPAEAWSPDTDPEPAPPPPGPPAEDPSADADDADTEYPMWQPDAEPEPEPVPARALPPDSPEEMENADTELMPPPNSAPLTGMGVSQDSLIMAVVCQFGHASAHNATTCRICGSAIAPQGPQLLPRPVMAVLRSSDGTAADVDRAVLVGRAPSAQRSTARAPKLMTVPSPGHDISRTHLEVAPEGWTIVVTDLHSTNGTTLVRPGGAERHALPAGEAVPVELGSVVELGDGISVLIDFPQ